MKEVDVEKPSKDVLTIANYLMEWEKYRAIEEEVGGYASERRTRLAAQREECLKWVPGLREIVTRGKG
jgi:hypothetical protein